MCKKNKYSSIYLEYMNFLGNKWSRVIIYTLVSVAIECITLKEVMANAQSRTEPSKDITAFFTNYLTGKSTMYNRGKNLKQTDVESYKTAVWKAWEEANIGFSEEKLIDIDELAKARSGVWHLPGELEPNAAMPYYWGTKGVRPEKGYPLFLYLHGSGAKDSEWKTGLAICSQFDDSPSLYFIPQIPNEGQYYRWWQRSKQFAWEKLLRQAFLSGQVDPDRIYVFGISEGGYGSQRLASFYADYLAAAGPMAGGEPLKNAPAENCRNIAFSLRTGQMDGGFYRNILTYYAREVFDSLQNCHQDGFIHKIGLIPQRGHAIDYRPTTPWMKQYVRNPYPKQVNWEDFEMDGWHRKGFYNIYVAKRPNEKLRAYYEMKIEKNEINLSIKTVKYEVIQKDPNWGIEMKFKKDYVPATGGRLTLFLCNELVDLSKPVVLRVNGKKVYDDKVKSNLKNLVNSCAFFFDPQRLYPAAIDVTY